MKTAFAFLLLAASAQAFLPATAPKMPVRAANAAPPILLSASSALATEGTGEPFGYDNIAQVVCQVVVAHVIAITWKQWENTQPDNDTDFFGEYDQRRA